MQYFCIKEIKIKLYKYFVSKGAEQEVILKKEPKPLVINVRLEILFDLLKHEFNLVPNKGI